MKVTNLHLTIYNVQAANQVPLWQVKLTHLTDIS